MLILDIESSGLEPQIDCMLELAMLHVSDDLETVLDSFTTLVYYEHGLDAPMREVAALEQWNEIVIAMHEASGLFDALDAVDNTAPHVISAERFALSWLDDQHSRFGIDVHKEPMVGSSIHFDRGFLKMHMPDLEKQFFYRNCDISSLKEVVKRWRSETYGMLPEGRKTHRALPDCEDSLVELRFYKQHVIDPVGQPA